jgi:RNA polymerase sigma-70 factor (ECF subfamily)
MDGGGKVAVTTSQPVQGRDKVARGIIAHLARRPGGMTVEVVEVNGLPALLGRVEGRIVNVVTLEVQGDLIHAIRTVLNPDKLAHLYPPAAGQESPLRS